MKRMIKALLILLVGVGIGHTLAAAPVPAASAIVISSAALDEVIAAAPRGRVSDQQIRMIDAGGHNVGLGVVHRPASAPGGAIQHHQQTEIYRVMEGAGVLVTGEALADARPLDPDGMVVQQLTGPSSMGTIEGGESHRIATGDMIIIPAGVAHGFSSLESDITYVVVRVDPDQVVRLK